MAGCPMEMTGRHFSRCDNSRIEVWVHFGHDDAGEDEHRRSSVHLLMLAPGTPARPDGLGDATRAELSDDDLHKLADLMLPRALDRANQLAPSHLAGRPPAQEIDYLEPIAMIETAYDGDKIAVNVHHGHEGGEESLHPLTFVNFCIWPADGQPHRETVVMLLPDDVRDLNSMLARARRRARPGAAR